MVRRMRSIMAPTLKRHEEADMLTGVFPRLQVLGKYMREIDLALPHSYEIEEVPALPGTGKFNVPLLYFPQPNR